MIKSDFIWDCGTRVNSKSYSIRILISGTPSNVIKNSVWTKNTNQYQIISRDPMYYRGGVGFTVWAQLRSFKSKFKYVHFSFSLFIGDLHIVWIFSYKFTSRQSLIDRKHGDNKSDVKRGQLSLFRKTEHLKRDSLAFWLNDTKIIFRLRRYRVSPSNCASANRTAINLVAAESNLS